MPKGVYERTEYHKNLISIGLTGKSQVEEHTRKIALANTGKKRPEEAKKKMSINMLGKSFEDRMGVDKANEAKRKISKRLKGIKKIDEARKNIARGNIGKRNHNPWGYGKWGYRIDLNQFFRSTWEANIARILNFLGIEWEYEKHRIRLSDCSFLIDFYLLELNLYIEIKGARFGNRDRKIILLYEEQPSFPIKIIEGKAYKELTKIFRDKILLWKA